MTLVAILGTGLIGSSIGLRLREQHVYPDLTVVGFDRYRRSAQAARKVGAIDQIAEDPQLAVRDADLVILSAPVLSNHWLMEQIAGALKAGAVVTDTGSTKAETLRQARKHLPATAAFVGGHPMAGKIEVGAEAAESTLFEGARWVVVPPADAPETAVNAIVHLAQQMGAEPMFMDPQEHDAYVAAISHLPLIAAIALFRLVRGSEAWPELSLLAAGGLKDSTRVAGTDPAVAYDIIVTNREQIAHWIDRMGDSLATLKKDLLEPANDENLFKLLAQTELEYTAYRAGKVGRESATQLPDAAGFDFSSFLMGEAVKQKMHEITNAQEERVRERDAERRSRREV
jgi:prephenate dehydrogenase